jgi:hypothetical protein
MKTRIKYLSLATAILFVSFSGVQTAEAKLKVRVNVRTPRVSVRINDAPVPHRQVEVRRAPLPVRRHSHYDITKLDRKVARRLARYADVSKSELISLRRQGYRWSEIGRWLDISRRAVYAAQDRDSWKRFLRDEARYSRYDRDYDRGYYDRDVCSHR